MILDNLTITDAPKRTKEGYLGVRAKSARTGVQDYLGFEVDPEGRKFKAFDRVAVYRPEAEVMSEKSIRSFIMKPITDDHPTEAVTADNYTKLAKGMVAGAVRDGDYISFDLMFMDAATIKKIESGKVELSNGYSTELEFSDGVSPDGKPYQAIQKSIIGNHVALVDKARAGPDCAIGLCDAMTVETFRTMLRDNTIGDEQMPDVKLVQIVRDGLPFEVNDAARVIIEGLDAKLAKMNTDAAKQATDHASAIAAKDAKIATLDAENATLKTAQVTDADLDKRVEARAKLVSDAKKIAGDKLDVTGANADIKKRAVLTRLGDGYKDRDAAFFDAAFELQVAGVGTRDTMRDGIQTVITDTNLMSDAEKARAARIKRFETAHLSPAEQTN